MKIKIEDSKLKIAFVLCFFYLFTMSSFAQIQGMNDPNKVLKPLYGKITPALSCEDLKKITIPNTVIESVIVNSKGYCMVTAVVNHPPANDQVKVWIGLPLKDWNGRFCGMGGGSYNGGFKAFIPRLTDRGCAVGVTDGGHEGGEASFALDTVNHCLNWQGIRDFAYLGIHDMTIVGKALVQAFYGKPTRYSYFIGGSTGGRQALTESQRYPEDYDGILAGFPAINWTRIVVGNLWPQAVMNDAKNLVPKAKLDAVTKALIAACDGDDGVVDGVIKDPFHCTWDPKQFVGSTVGGSTFTEADADVVRKIWEGARTHDGKFIWYGMPRGSDLFALAGTKGEPLKGDPSFSFLGWAQYFLKMNPNWDISTLTCAQLELLFNQSVEQFGNVFYGENADLRPFRNHGGKLLIVHGLNDQRVQPQSTITYFEQVQNRMGGAQATSKFVRLFLAPGIDHSLFGAGAKPFGTFDALVSWVEENKAPERLKGQLMDETGKIKETTTPLFFYPYVAR